MGMEDRENVHQQGEEVVRDGDEEEKESVNSLDRTEKNKKNLLCSLNNRTLSLTHTHALISFAMNEERKRVLRIPVGNMPADAFIFIVLLLHFSTKTEN